ncbi:MAG: sugar phosphate nucleotidyltransferase, partial [Bacteroidales bacterium]
GKITLTTPKALTEIHGKSLLRMAVEKCTDAGFDEIIVNVHHFADMLEQEIEKLNKSGFKISVSDERRLLLENGGGLYKARQFFGQSPFLVYNVDIVTDLDLSALYTDHVKNGCIATLAVRHRNENRVLLTDSAGFLRGWRNRSTGEEILSRAPISENLGEIAFSSVQMVDPEVFYHMYEGIYSIVSLYLQLAESFSIATFTHDAGYWFDIGTPESLESVRKYLLPG